MPSNTPRLDKIDGINNLTINGNLDFWQRGTSLTGLVTASATYLADRYLLRVVGTTATYRMDRSTDVPTFAQSGFQSSYSLAVQCTNPDATVNAADSVSIGYRMEGYDYAQIASGAPFRKSFWVKSVKAGIYCFSMNNAAADRRYIKEYTLIANTWTKITIDFNSDSAGTWLLDNGRGLLMQWTLMSGTDAQSTANSWGAGSANATSNQVNFSDSASNIFYIAQDMTIAGSFAASADLPFKRAGKNIGDELQKCLRYCYIVPNNNGFEFMLGMCYSGTSGILLAKMPVPMRVAPAFSSVTSSPIGSFFGVIGSAGGGVTLATLIIGGATTDTVRMALTTASGLVGGNATHLYPITGSSIIGFDAEL